MVGHIQRHIIIHKTASDIPPSFQTRPPNFQFGFQAPSTETSYTSLKRDTNWGSQTFKDSLTLYILATLMPRPRWWVTYPHMGVLHPLTCILSDRDICMNPSDSYNVDWDDTRSSLRYIHLYLERKEKKLIIIVCGAKSMGVLVSWIHVHVGIADKAYGWAVLLVNIINYFPEATFFSEFFLIN